MAVEIREVTGPREMRRFILLPWKIYKGDPNWVAPLIMDQKTLLSVEKNPFYKHCETQHFLAYKDGKPAGRISALVNSNYNEFQGEKTGFFGFFESVRDGEVSGALFKAAEDWVRARKMDRLRGPTNPSTNDTLGLLVDAFDQPPAVMMPYNPVYYVDLYQDYGLKKAKDLYSYYLEASWMITEKIKRVTELIRRRHNITVRHINIKKIDQEIELVKVIYNDAWSKNWGFVPWTDEELEHLGHELKPVAIAELVFFAYVDGEIAGFSLTLPDLYQALRHINGRLFPFGLFKLLWYSRKIDRVRTLAMGVRKQYRLMGIDAVFYYETFLEGTKRGLAKGECSWILEDNLPMRLALEKMGALRYKTYRLYDKEFSG